MKRAFWRCALPIAALAFFTASTAYCSTYYIAPNGNDANDGSIGNPWFTITKAVTAMSAGDTTYLRGGRYYYDTKVSISKSGNSVAKMNLFAYPGDARPILDFSAMACDGSSTHRGISLTGSYWYMKGFDIYKAGDNGMIIQGTYNRVEFCSFYENCDSGLQLDNGAAYNEIINCDSYYNEDPSQGNADGFSPKLTVGTGNYFYGCRSWNNSDDAYDCYLNAPTDNVTTTFENCWAIKAGYLKDGSAGAGNGNGFKMGSSTNHHNIILKNCLAFQNLKKGFDQNNNKGSMVLYNCTGFNNGTYDYSIPTAVSSGYIAKLANCISYSNSKNLVASVVQINDSWLSGFDVNIADFVSIDPSAATGPRNADGSLPTITFMHLASTSGAINQGTIDANVTWTYCGSAPDLGCFEYCSGGSAPGQASSPVPSTGATNVILTQDISWTAGSGATSRDVYFGTVNPPTTKVISNGTVLTYDTGTMTASTTYYWRVDEKNTYGTTTGIVWSFTTVPAAPGQASGPVPSNGAANVSLTQDISWTAGSGATSRDVYFGTVNPPTTKVISNGTVLTYDTGTMTASATYYWRVDEKNAGGTTTGTVWSFTTVPTAPGAATNPNPANAAANVNLTATLSWTAGSGAASHDVYFGTAISPPFTGNQAGTTYNPGAMASITTYYWRIDEKNAGGTTAGTVWSFTTQDIVAPLPNPMGWLIEPNAISSSSITMTAATATDISGVEYYFANITDPNHDSNWVSSPVWTDNGLVNNTTYTYQVKARDMSINHNETGWSGTANATTLIYICTSPIVSDLDGDCEVDFFDYAVLADAWRTSPPDVDLNNDGVMDYFDLAQFADEWLTCNRAPQSECWKQ
jgi:hypothetical protein